MNSIDSQFHNTLYERMQNEQSLSYSDFDIKNIDVDEIKESDSKMIKYTKLYYNNNGEKCNINLKTPQISHEVAFYNIPNISEFCKTDKDRAYLQFCFAHDRAAEQSIDYQAIEIFFKFINDVDNYLASDEMKKKLFGTNANQYEHKSSIKIEEEEKFDKLGKLLYLPPSLKLRIDMDKDNRPLCILLINNGGKYELVNHKSLDDIKNHIKYKCKLRFNISLNKIIITKSKPKKYWCIYKIRAILIDEIPVYKPKVQYALFDKLNNDNAEELFQEKPSIKITKNSDEIDNDFEESDLETLSA